MESSRLPMRFVALLTAVFLAVLALPAALAGAAGSSEIIFTSTDNYGNGAEFVEKDKETWQQICSFTVPASATDLTSVQLAVTAYDVDAPSEYDRIMISDGINQLDLGRLTGLDSETNITALDIPASFGLTAGQTYTLYVDVSSYDETNGRHYADANWWVYLSKIVLVINGGAGNGTVQPSMTPDAGNNQVMNTQVDLSNLTPGTTYSMEYKLSNLTGQKQIASARETFTTAAGETTKTFTKALTAGAADAIDVIANQYQLDVILSSDNGISTGRATLSGEPEPQPQPEWIPKDRSDIMYAISIEAHEGGSTNPSQRIYVSAEQNSPVIQFIPDAGYRVADVIIDGTSIGTVGSYLFENVTANHTVKVVFGPVVAPPQTGALSVAGIAITAILAGAGCLVAARKKH